MATNKPETTKSDVQITEKEAKANTVSKAQFEQLQESYRTKCAEYNQLLEAYRALAIRYTNDGKKARHFIESAMMGIDLIFPNDNNSRGE